MVMEKMNEFKQIPKEFWDDDEWAEKHYPELQKRFRDQWVAVANKKVITHGKNLAKVEEEARLKTGKRHISVTFVESGDHVY